MLILVPSHDDAGALRVALPVIRAGMRPGRDRLVVIADRCSDDTASAARSAGAEALVREDDASGPGKGGALRFALAAIGGDPREPVAIFDADSEPSAGFFEAAEAAWAGGARALQGFVDPVPGRSLLSRIAAYSEIVSQRMTDRLRASLGWGVPLRGTGMVIERGLLSGALARCATFVEDLETTLLLAADGVRVRPLGARVRDPKPGSGAGVVRQRARWLAGNLAAFRARNGEIRRLMGSLSGATLVVGLFAKPRSLFFSARLILFLALLPAAGSAPIGVVEVLLGLFLLRDLALLFGGLAVVDRPGFYLPAVLAAPVYPLVWAAGAVRSLSARGRWLSARRGA
ncbi:MAG TPA: glycosyltransferase [Thermoanaerobaculia bacterium]|nr:glycosyltransferase [Thermoanaerobaculia bacterium]